MSAYGHGRHENGQNFLTNHKIINSIIDLVKQTSGPIGVIGQNVCLVFSRLMAIRLWHGSCFSRCRCRIAWKYRRFRAGLGALLDTPIV